jgi:hypothetical protein
LPLNVALAVYWMSVVLNVTKQSIAKLISGFIALVLGFLIYAVIAPSLMSNSVAVEQGMEPLFINPKIILGLVVLVPVVFCVQTKFRWLKLTGWLLLFLMVVLVFV